MSKYYKYCIVPKCTSSTSKTPHKLFISMPNGHKIREKWCKAIKRYGKNIPKLSAISRHHVCEDHFDLEKDIENYMRHKFRGGNIYLKKDVIPHKFDCQKTSIVKKRTTGERRRRLEIISPLLNESLLPVATKKEDNPTTSVKSSLSDKSINVNLRPSFKSKRTSAILLNTNYFCSPIKIPTLSVSTLPLKKEMELFSSDDCSNDECNDFCSPIKIPTLSVSTSPLKRELELSGSDDCYGDESLIRIKITNVQSHHRSILKKVIMNNSSIMCKTENC